MAIHNATVLPFRWCILMIIGALVKNHISNAQKILMNTKYHNTTMHTAVMRIHHELMFHHFCMITGPILYLSTMQ